MVGHPVPADGLEEVAMLRLVPHRYVARIDAADAFVVVTPEYNHVYPASLEQAIDVADRQWNARPHLWRQTRRERFSLDRRRRSHTAGLSSPPA